MQARQAQEEVVARTVSLLQPHSKAVPASSSSSSSSSSSTTTNPAHAFVWAHLNMSEAMCGNPPQSTDDTNASLVDAYIQRIYESAQPGTLMLIVTQPDTVVLRRFQQAIIARQQAFGAGAGGQAGAAGGVAASATWGDDVPSTLSSAMDLVKTGLLLVACKGR
jgi:hypothetical protein